MQNKSLLIGNGINRLTPSNPTWNNILEEVAKKLSSNVVIDTHIPNTIFFDCMIFNKGEKNDAAVKETLGNLLKNKFTPNEYHKKVFSKDINHIMTTNYDCSLENVNNSDWTTYSIEKKYSLFRRNRSEDITIWHIHGDLTNPNSIMLGYDHYAGYLQKIRGYCIGNSDSSSIRKSPFISKKNILDDEKNSWIDVFLKDDIDILGLDFGFTEIDLWWVLGLKKRLKNNKYEVGQTRYINIFDEENEVNKSKINAMGLLDVEIISIKIDNKSEHKWLDGYDKYFNENF